MSKILYLMKECEFLALLLIFSSYFFAIKIPDLDFKLKLRHRSIITHSPLFTLILIVLYQAKKKDYFFVYFIIGFSLALGVHMLFDLFPKKWHGAAMLKIPVNNISCSKKTTIKFFILTTIFSFYTAIFYCNNIKEVIFIYFLGTLSIFRFKKYEAHFYRPLLCFNLIFFIFSVLKYKLIMTLTLKLFNNII